MEGEACLQGFFVGRADFAVKIVRMEAFDAARVVGRVPFFGFFVADRAQRDTIFCDISACGEFVAIGDVVCVQHLCAACGDTAHRALVAVALEDAFSKDRADDFFILAHWNHA